MIVANSQETIVGIPITVPVVEVEVPLGIVLVEVRHVAVAIDLTNGPCVKNHPWHCSPIASRKLHRIRDINLSLGFSHQLSLYFLRSILEILFGKPWSSKLSFRGLRTNYPKP